MASPDKIIHSMNSVTLNDEEEGGFVIEDSLSNEGGLHIQGFDSKLCVVGRFISEGRVDFTAMQHTMVALWKPGKGVYMKELDTNLYLFHFYHEIDVKRVMEGCPWSFNRRALVMARLKEGGNPRCVELNSIDLWVQIHDLKVGFMSEKIFKGIGNYIGCYVDSCSSNFAGVWREYMRIRVTLSLNAPLKRRMKIKMSGDEWFWVNFKYENVPTFCFICGFLGHSEKFCSKLFEIPEGEIIKPYGPWMRAPFRNQVKPIGAKWLRSEFGGDEHLMDPLLADTCCLDDFLRCMHIGLLCVQEDSYDRPTMSSVVMMLNCETTKLCQPERPAYSIGRLPDHQKTCYNNLSINDLSISNAYPR